MKLTELLKKITPLPCRIWRDMDPKEPAQITGMDTDFICAIDSLNTNRQFNPVSGRAG